MGWLQDVVNRLKLQVATEEDIRRADVIREIIYRRVEEMLVWGQLIPTVNMDRPMLRLEFPSKIEVEGPLSPYAVAKTDVIEWSKVEFEFLEKYEGRFIVTDVAEALEYEAQVQYRTGVRRLAESMQKKEDAEIQSAVDAAVKTTLSAAAAWNVSGADPAGDMVKCIRELLKVETATLDDIKNINFVMPVNCYSEIMKLQEIKNIRTSLLDWMQATYGVKFFPTKTLTTTMYALFAGPDTGRHYVWRPPRVPLAEERRIHGVGREYIIRRFFKTYIIPDDATTTKTSRIVKMTGVWS